MMRRFWGRGLVQPSNTTTFVRLGLGRTPSGIGSAASASVVVFGAHGSIYQAHTLGLSDRLLLLAVVALVVGS